MILSSPGTLLPAIINEMQNRVNSTFDLAKFCFPEQLAFIRDPAPFKTGVCSRRAGKTTGCAADLLDTAKRNPHRVSVYITLSRKNAKKLIWPELLGLNREHNLGGVPNISDLSITFPNGHVIYCSGAQNASEIENFRGMAIVKAYIDEAQSFRAYIEDLIDDVLSKALFDYAGSLCLIGTPGLVPTGYFYKCTQSMEWSHHHWTMFQNPHLERKSGKTVQELVETDCKRMGVGIDHPKIQRECYGRWVTDTDSLIFKYNPALNHFGDLAAHPTPWSYVIGVDIGHDDADAIAVIGWNEKTDQAYLVEEFIKSKQGITELAEQIESRIKKYDPIKVVMDSGGLGKKIAEELRRRRAIPIVAAEKTRKIEFIELLNDAMRTGRFFAKQDSAFAQDCFLVERDKDKTTSEKTVISDKYHSDICDAVLYGWREALNWLHEPEPIYTTPGTPAWVEEQEQEMEAKIARDLSSEREGDNWYGMGFNE